MILVLMRLRHISKDLSAKALLRIKLEKQFYNARLPLKVS
jgi:hypothetical protein